MKTGAADYYGAFLERKSEFEKMLNEKEFSLISLYLAGVGVECLLRSYIWNTNKEFDARHDLNNIYAKCPLKNELTIEDKINFQKHIQILASYWKNDLRYYSKKKFKREFGNEFVRKKYRGDIESQIKKFCDNIFESSLILLEIGSKYDNH